VKRFWQMALVCILAFSVLVLDSCQNVAQPVITPRPPCQGSASANERNCRMKVLVFSKTAGYRHASIENGIAVLREQAQEKQVSIDFTEDATLFNDDTLKQYRAVIFLMTSGDIFDAAQQAAFERYIRAGGGYAGVHSASDTEYKWPWYGKLVGAYFKNHPQIQKATVHVLNRQHLSTSALPERWEWTDEWYNFTAKLPDDIHVLMTVDETTYEGGRMGTFHPIAWYHSYDGGRAWYTALGHIPESYRDPLFVAHLWGGILYAAGNTP
jgi:type 1 glutamine amidotransferase